MLKEKLSVNKPVRTVYRSDGAAKIYGWTTDGKFLTVVMVRRNTQNYDIKELKIAGEYRIYDYKKIKE